MEWEMRRKDSLLLIAAESCPENSFTTIPKVLHHDGERGPWDTVEITVMTRSLNRAVRKGREC